MSQFDVNSVVYTQHRRYEWNYSPAIEPGLKGIVARIDKYEAATLYTIVMINGQILKFRYIHMIDIFQPMDGASNEQT